MVQWRHKSTQKSRYD